MADVKVAATAKPVAKAVAVAAAKPAAAKTAEVKVEAKTEVAKKPAPAKKAVAKKETPKKETVKKETAKKAPANKEKAIVNLQFDGKSYTAEDLVRIAKDVWQYDLQRKPADFDTVELYVKPEESQVYYVINEEVTGCFAI